jgi:hypothetical protein
VKVPGKGAAAVAAGVMMMLQQGDNLQEARNAHSMRTNDRINRTACVCTVVGVSVREVEAATGVSCPIQMVRHALSVLQTRIAADYHLL